MTTKNQSGGYVSMATESEKKVLMLAMEFVIANRMNSKLHMNSEYAELAAAAEAEYTRRKNLRDAMLKARQQ